MGGAFEGPLHDIEGKPSKVGTLLLIVRRFVGDTTLMGLVKRRKVRKESVSCVVFIRESGVQHGDVFAISSQIKGAIARRIINGVKLFFVIIKITIQDRRVPEFVRVHGDVREFIPFGISERTKRKAR